MKTNHNKKRTGTLSIEMFVAVSVMAVLIGVLATIGSSFKKLDNQLWLQHTCSAAGQSQIDALATTGKAIDEETFGRLWPNVTCSIEVTEGTGDWHGLQLIQLHLTATSRGKTVELLIARYISANKELHI